MTIKWTNISKKELEDKYDLNVSSTNEMRAIFNTSLNENINEIKKYTSFLMVNILSDTLTLNLNFENNHFEKKYGKLTIKIFFDNDKLGGKTFYNTKTIEIYLKSILDLETEEFEEILAHEVAHYLNYERAKDKNAFKGTANLEGKDYYGSNEEFEPFAIYFIKQYENAFKNPSLPFVLPQNRSDYPKEIFKQIIPYIKKHKSKVLFDFIDALSEKQLRRLYKMSIDYFAESIEQGMCYNNIGRWVEMQQLKEYLEENK